MLLKLREWIQIRNQEMEYLTFGYLNAQLMIEKECQKLGIDSKTFWQSTKASLLEKKPIRVSSPTIVYSNGETIVSNSITIEKPSLNSKSCLKGQPVYGSGTLEAEVYVAFSSGEVPLPSKRPAALVTGMTTPDFVPLLRKHFDALITDEGGILCHAAIIAREIPIPCIVGTGVGSDVLKTGMRVKIELNRGEISYS
jgi:phosphoenolpyruvate synthase/pyruvate phosphate dikinase